ncbi:Toxin YoeB [subsurface metagenome]
MRSIVFEGNTWNIYEKLRSKDKVLHKNLCKILKEIQREDPTIGLGKPEPLKHNLLGFWSRRISQKGRLIYKFDDKSIHIFAMGGHYNQKVK